MPPPPTPPLPTVGYWGPPTSTLDWCEENYALSPYIAEFWNTISNITFFVLASSGIYYSLKTHLGRPYLLCFLSLILVGAGSSAFHMTLLYQNQLFDELPMLWGSLLMIYVQSMHLYPLFTHSLFHDRLLKLVLTLYGIFYTASYLLLKTPLLHQVAFGIIITLVTIGDLLILKWKKCNFKLFLASAFFCYGAFVVWVIDNLACESLRTLRTAQSGFPALLAPLTQLHAWWHFGTGLGSYLHILFVAHSHSLYSETRLKTRLTWHSGIILDSKVMKK